MISKASFANIFSISWPRTSDRGDPDWYIGNDIRVRARGGGEPRKGMRYPSRRTDSTQDSVPIVCQCLQCADRQPPHATDETPCQNFFPASPHLATGAAGGRRKGRLTFAPLPLPTLLGRGRGRRHLSLLLLSKTPTRGKPPVQPRGDLAHTREHGLQRGYLGVGQGNGMFPRLTHLLEGDQGQAGWDCIRTRKYRQCLRLGTVD